MLAALRAFDRFDRRRPLAPWLHRIAVNRALDYVRARGRRRESGADPLAVAGEGIGGETGISSELADALAKLDPLDTVMVVMRYLLAYRSAEIGELLGLPAGTVRRRLREALARMRVTLTSEEELA